MSMQELMRGPDGPIDILKALEPDAYAHVQDSVTRGLLPPDTFIRLDSIGDGTTDPTRAEQSSLRWEVLLDLDRCAEAPEHLPPRTRNTVFGEPPRALLSWDPTADAETLHTMYDRPYLVRTDLVEVIKERRVEEGKTVTKVPEDRRWRPAQEIEHGQCMRIAHGLWSTLARRIMPEWLEPDALDMFYRPHKDGKTIDLGGDRQVMNRRIVGAIALKITHIRDIYDESLSQGVRGIGPVGRQDLRSLLSDEYPELH